MRKNFRCKTRLLHAVARASGVSLATAYRAATAPHSVAEETRRRVLKMMKARAVSITPRPRVVRRPGAARRAGRIVFLAPQMPFRTVEMVSEEMLHGIQRAVDGRGLEIALQHYPWEAKNAAAITELLGANFPDGILLRPTDNRDVMQAVCRNRNAILLGNGFSDLDLPCVIADDAAALRLVMDYLFELGHRRIGFMSLAPRMLIYRRRLDAYVASLHRLGLTLDARLIKLQEHWSVPAEETHRLCRRFLGELLGQKAPPTGVVCATDSFAAGLVQAARERGLRVPGDLSVTGFGDQYFSALMDPPLTTVQVNQREIGEIAVLQLLQMIAGAPAPSLTLTRPKLIERRSCAAAQSVVSDRR